MNLKHFRDQVSIKELDEMKSSILETGLEKSKLDVDFKNDDYSNILKNPLMKAEIFKKIEEAVTYIFMEYNGDIELNKPFVSPHTPGIRLAFYEKHLLAEVTMASIDLSTGLYGKDVQFIIKLPHPFETI